MNNRGQIIQFPPPNDLHWPHNLDQIKTSYFDTNW